MRDNGIVRRRAVLIAIGINWDGRRNVLGVELANRESTTSWRVFIEGLLKRGLRGVEFVVSDHHEGLKAAIAQMLTGQRGSAATCISCATLSTICRAKLTNITANSLLPSNHRYRRIAALLDLRGVEVECAKLYAKVGAPGIDIHQGLRMLIVQFMEDLSDRQMQAEVAENIAVKWFCGYEEITKVSGKADKGKGR